MAVETTTSVGRAETRPSYLIPERTQAHGPLVAARLRRTGLDYGPVRDRS